MMIIERIFTPGLAQVAYLVGDERTRELAVIDPRRDISVYTQWASEHGYRITAILETHVHADFVSGSLELVDATNAPLHASRLGNLEFHHEPLDDGFEVTIGDGKLITMTTPGHSPEHLSFLLVDPDRGAEPYALFSGDALLVGEVGRPDLLGDERTQELTEQLYHTITDRLAALDDAVLVYPGHTAGSSCGRNIGDAPSTTIGAERMFNYAFQATSQEAFVELVLRDMPLPPTSYPILKRLNRSGAPRIDDLDPGRPLSPAEIEEYAARGAAVIDTRSTDAFATAHVPGALFAGIGPDFVAWMSWLAPYDRDLVLIVENAEVFAEAQLELRRIGLDRVVGFGSMSSWIAEDRPVASLAQIAAADLADRLQQQENGLLVLDVRTLDEWQERHIGHALHQVAGEILQGADPIVDRDEEFAIICGSGYRSTVVSSVLTANGYTRSINVIGGMEALEATGAAVA